jgi:hypothetical protein
MLLLEKCNKNTFTLYATTFPVDRHKRKQPAPDDPDVLFIVKGFFLGEYGQNPGGVFSHFVKQYEKLPKCIWRIAYILEK